MPAGIRHGRLDEIEEHEARFEFLDPSQFLSSNANHIPYQNSVQGTRAFYGARFIPQSVAQRNPEAAWVQNLNPLDKQGRSFDQISGKSAGAVFADDDGEVEDVAHNLITYRTAAGEQKKIPLYQTMPYNRKSGLHQTPVVEKGQKLTKGAVLARSNFTDAAGTLALGRNARVGLVADKGHSMDDAVVISQAFADALESEHIGTYEQDWDDHTRGGREHFTSLFPKKFTVDQLEQIDDDGFVKPGTVLKPGDPISLASAPRSISSATANLGQMSRSVRMARRDASQVWDGTSPGEVTDVVQTKTGKRAVIRSYQTAQVGDKVAYRSGQKGTISTIIPNDRMPRTADGQPLDVLSNQLGLVSRANASLPYEALQGKIAAATGKAVAIPSFNPVGSSWLDTIQAELAKHGMTDKERVFDPAKGQWLRNPITVGNAYLLKLHHTADSKSSSRGSAAYDSDQQPQRGGGDAAQSKRLSGLESHALLSSGAYAVLREGSTLRGQRNDAYWRALRQGQTPKPPGKPFVWDKFQALLAGTGLLARNLGDGRLRLGPFTDKELDKHAPVEIRNGGMVDLRTMEPSKGGLFDPSLAAANKWGVINLPRPVPNPAFEEAVRAVTGMTKKEFQEVLNGDRHLPPHLIQRIQSRALQNAQNEEKAAGERALQENPEA